MSPHIALHRLIHGASILEDVELRFCAIMGLALSLRERLAGSIDSAALPLLTSSFALDEPMPPGRFAKGDGTFVVIDPNRAISREAFHRLVGDVASMPNPGAREAALIHIVIGSLQEPSWIAA